MGAQLVSAAVVHVMPHLGRHHKARVALTVMALTAKDTDSEPVYFAGWRPIARALGLSGTNDSQRTTVSRVWRELIEAGCIKATSSVASSRTTGTWQLLVDRWPLMNQPPLPVDNHSDGG